MEIGPGLSAVVREQVEKRAAMAGGDKLDALLYTMPVRVRKIDQGRWEGDSDGKPFDRTTVSRDWHKAALQDPDLRDMPLHALRHTAAAAWLAGGNSLKYVQDQLGHGDIRTTERYYGHLERHVKKEGARRPRRRSPARCASTTAAGVAATPVKPARALAERAALWRSVALSGLGSMRPWRR